jgi:hypothetical protein
MNLFNPERRSKELRNILINSFQIEYKKPLLCDRQSRGNVNCLPFSRSKRSTKERNTVCIGKSSP